jgi:hypothetical protein
MSNSLLANFIGIFALIVSILKHFEKINSVYQGTKKMDVKSFENNHNLINILANGLWIIYGIKNKDFPIFLTHIVLFFIYMYYMNSYFWVNHEKDNMYKYSGICIFSWIFGYYLLQKDIAGFFALIVLLCSFYFVLKEIQRCLETKSNEDMTLLEIQMSVASTGLWVIYGLFLTHQLVIWVSNLIGFLIMLIYLLTFYWTKGSIEDQHFLVINLKKLFRVEGSGKYDNLVIENTNQMDKRLKDDF